MATAKELQELKRQWQSDPIWGIYETEGFEEHKDELKAYQEEWEKIWETERYERLKLKAGEMGIADNLDLAQYIQMLEYRIDELERRLNS